jgi:hypothetical protein
LGTLFSPSSKFAVLFFWIWILITVMVDIFRSHKMSEHAAQTARDQGAMFRQYVRGAAGSPADDIAKLADLSSRGVITDEEFERAKQKTLS